MKRNFVKNINGQKINLLLLDSKYQNDPFLMINYLCKKTKAKKEDVERIVTEYFRDAKGIEIDKNYVINKKVENIIKGIKIFFKIYFILILIICFVMFVMYFIAKANNQADMFLSLAFNMSEINLILTPFLKIFKTLGIILVILLIIEFIFFIIYFIYKKIKEPKTKETVINENFEIISNKEETSTVDEILGNKR